MTVGDIVWVTIVLIYVILAIIAAVPLVVREYIEFKDELKERKERESIELKLKKLEEEWKGGCKGGCKLKKSYTCACDGDCVVGIDKKYACPCWVACAECAYLVEKLD